MQKIVTIGGGTGHYQILRGLKNRDCNITAVVNVCDDGGHSGNLRDEYGVLPPGDSRQCLIALSESSGSLRKLFEHRIKNINFGNLFIAGLEDLYGGASMALSEAGKILNISGKVVPVTEDSFHINAKLEDGSILRGQTQVSYPASEFRIMELFTEGNPCICKEAADAFREADKIIICPGDLYGSIIPNFLVLGVREAIKESKAKLIYVCNLVTKQGSYSYKASDFVSEIEKYLGRKIDKIILNASKISEEVVKNYLGENSEIVEDDLFSDMRVVRADIIEECASDDKKILRHHPVKVSREIIGIS